MTVVRCCLRVWNKMIEIHEEILCQKIFRLDSAEKS